MTPQRYRQIDRLFERALKVNPSERISFLESTCGEDDELRHAVEALLAAHDDPTSLATPALSAVDDNTTERHARFKPKDRLGPYEIIGMLGVGGMGEVYRARDLRLEREVAVKVLTPRLDHDSEALKRFEQEARTVAALSHPNVLTLFDIGLDRGLPFVITELLEGETLRARLDRGPLNWTEFAEIGRSVANGLAAGHAKGIVHRDVKPENIFITVDGRVKILDFGIASIRRTESSVSGPESGAFWGTPLYMSPEQASGLPIDHRSDVFSLGVVLYEIVTGVRPFAGDSLSEIAENVIHTQPPAMTSLRPDTPRVTERIILRCLSKNAPNRYQEAGDIARALKPAEQPVRLTPASTNLPSPLNRFIGRSGELEEIRRLLGRTRALTLVGSGGCGKSRLALEAGRRLFGLYAEGVWIVELASIADASIVPRTVASCLGVKEERNRTLEESIARWIAPRELLLILDNCEHLIESCARLAEALLKACPKASILSTSREPLRISGEVAWRVPSLPLPELRSLETLSHEFLSALSQNDAIALFVDRATTVAPGLHFTEQDTVTLAEICHRLDGIPLAIELAAARMLVLTPKQLSQKLADRLSLLTTGGRTMLPRHRTLRSTLDWSYEFLSPKERLLFQRLSVFAGGWTLAAAETVCAGTDVEAAEILELLSALVDKSLVVSEWQDEREMRFRYLETIRQYARERLNAGSEALGVHRQHTKLFLSLAEEAKAALEADERSPWLKRLSREQDNLRAAFTWGLEHAGWGLPFALALWPFLRLTGHFGEGRKYLTLALAREEASTASVERVRGLAAAGQATVLQGDYASARAWFDESRRLSSDIGDKRGLAAALRGLGEVARLQDEYDAAVHLAEEYLSVMREIGEPRGVAKALSDLGDIARLRGSYSEARAFLGESIVIQRECGEDEGLAESLTRLGVVEQFQREYSSARSYMTESLEIWRRLQFGRGIQAALCNLAVLATLEGDYAQARALNEECLEINRESEDRWGMCANLINLGVVCRHEGDYSTARQMLTEGIALSRELGTKRATAAGLVQLAITARLQDDRADSRKLTLEGIGVFRELQNLDGLAYCFENVAALALSEQRMELAARIWGFADKLRQDWKCPLPPEYTEEYGRDVAAARHAIGHEAFTKFWAEGAEIDLDQAIKLSS